MSESDVFESGGGSTLVDPSPEDLALVLDAMIATGPDAANDPGLEPWRLTDRRLLAELAAAQLQATRAKARWLALLAEAEHREATVREAGLTTASWLTDQNTHWARSARDEVRFAVRLADEPIVAHALTKGALSVEQAQVIMNGLTRLPSSLDGEQRERVAEQLVEFAKEFGPYGLARLTDRAVEVVAPEIAEDADRLAVERVELEQARDRFLAWRKDSDGAWLLRGKLGKVAGQQLVGLLRSLAARQRAAVLLAGDEIAPGQAAADALVTLADHFSSCGEVPRYGADQPRVLVSVDYDVLVGRLGAATLLNTGESISASEARRLACDAGILPAVMNGDSVALDVGRERRLFGSTLRQVLIARDQGCAFPGCDRGPAECEAHHIRPWWDGGATALSNGVLVCSFHHHLVEPDPNAPPEASWRLRLDAKGRPEFGAPQGRGVATGERRWRQHHRFRT